MSSSESAARSIRPAVVIGAGTLIGLGLLYLASLDAGLAVGHPPTISVNGLPYREARDLLLPAVGWTLQVDLDPPLAEAEARPELLVVLREERTGMTIEIQDQLVPDARGWTFQVPEALGVREGLLAVHARATFADGSVAEQRRRWRIRPFFGGPPIGERQIVHFDFTVDRDGDGRVEFEQDLVALGLVAPESPALLAEVAERIAQRALERVERAFDDRGDPNRTGHARDAVAVDFRLDGPTDLVRAAFTTRICVGGSDPDQPGSVGHVRFDRRNAHKQEDACEQGERAGLFPAELAVYAASPLFREALGGLRAADGGTPIGAEPDDAARLAARTGGTQDAGSRGDTRRAQIERAIDTLGDVLGTLMAHEAGHALGLVPPGRPPVGLFGGDAGEAWAHAAASDARGPSLMDPGRQLTFEQLAGEAPGGPLRFRAIDWAWLRDRVVLADERGRAPGEPGPSARALE
ncbi:MAG: hypothetical protein R3F35_12520 [Myxococcota bacterium]